MRPILVIAVLVAGSGCWVQLSDPSPSASCSAANCAGGCCQGTTCVLGDQDRACGINGAACADCGASSRVCRNRACVASTPTCTTNCPCTGASCPPDYRDTGRACTRNGDCSNGTCLPLGTKNVCTLGCSASSTCVPGWTCASFAGVTGNLCQCTPAAETCNGKDDDCNGTVDDAWEADQACQKQGAGYACVSGACTCVAPYVDCAGQCVDPRTTPWTACGSACVDPRTDVNNCGGCGRTCSTTLAASKAECIEGTCRVRTELGTSGIQDLAIGGGNLVWTTYADSVTRLGKLYSCPVAGCPSSGAVLVRSGLPDTGGVAVAGSQVFWGDTTPVRTCVLPTCSPVTLYADSSALTWGVDLVTTASSVYFSTIQRGTNTAAVMSCPLAGCGTGPTVVAAQLPSAGVLRADATHVYWVQGTSVKRCPLTGACTPSLVTTSGSSSVYDFAVDGTNIYFPDFQAGVIVSCPVTGCATPTRFAASTTTNGGGVAVDDTTVYWCAGSRVMSCPKAGCTTPVEVSSGRYGNYDCMRVLLDGSFVYWTDSSGIIYRVNK